MYIMLITTIQLIFSCNHKPTEHDLLSKRVFRIKINYSVNSRDKGGAHTPIYIFGAAFIINNRIKFSFFYIYSRNLIRSMQ